MFRLNARAGSNQLGGAAPDHVGCGVCPRPGDDAWHHGAVRHAQAQNAVHAELRVDNGELVCAHLTRTDCVSKTRRGKPGKFFDLLSARLGAWNEFALAQIVECLLTSELACGLNGAQDRRKIVIGGEIVAIDYGGVLKRAAGHADRTSAGGLHKCWRDGWCVVGPSRLDEKDLRAGPG